MYSLETPILQKRFSKTSQSDYPDQEVYANLPDAMEGKYQPILLGTIDWSGSALPITDKFMKAIPTITVDQGTQQAAPNDMLWRGRKAKICADIKNPETGTVHGLSVFPAYRFNTISKLATQLTGTTNFTRADNNTEIDMVSGSANGDLNLDDDLRVYAALLDDASGTFTGSASATIGIPPDLIHFLLVCIAGVPTSRLDLASLTNTGTTKQGVSGTWKPPDWALAAGLTAADFVCGIYIADQMTVQEAVDTLAFQCGYKLTFSGGKFKLIPMNESRPSNTVVLTDIDMDEFVQSYSLDSFINRIAVRHSQTPAGAENLTFSVPFTGTKKQRKRKKYQDELNKTFTSETEAFKTEYNDLTRTVGSVAVLDDLLNVLVRRNEELKISTMYNGSTAVGVSKALANEIFRRFNRGILQSGFIDINGKLMDVRIGSGFVIARKRSARGDISDGRMQWLMDAVKNFTLNAVKVNRADEIKIDLTGRSQGVA